MTSYPEAGRSDLKGHSDSDEFLGISGGDMHLLVLDVWPKRLMPLNKIGGSSLLDPASDFHNSHLSSVKEGVLLRAIFNGK